MSESKLKKFSILLTAVPLALLLITIILCSLTENLHSTLLSVGENNWSGYSELRQPAVKPDCDLNAAAPAAPTEEDDLLDDLFDDKEEEASEEALAAARAVCKEKMDKYESIIARQNDSSLQTFISVETSVGNIATHSVGYGKHFLVIVFILCAIAVTLQRQHLGLRLPKSRDDDRVSQSIQLIGNLIVTGSFYAYYRQDLASGVENVSNLPIFWMIGFGAMVVCNIILLIRPLAPPEDGKAPGWGEKLLGVPLYAYMALICGFYFQFVENHYAGVAIYINQMTEHADLYLNVALYVFCGMMLKYTNIADKFFALLRPWKLSPELLVFFIVVLSAIPTAYSGASGIFVLAAGALIYRELKRAKARDTLALAATAMSGSMGIVLSPCLIVVIIAALDKNVTTGELFSAGKWVFAVNIAIFALVLLITRKQPLKAVNPIIAFPKMMKALVPVLPYLAIGAAVLLTFRYALGAAFDEYSAAYLLPFVLLMLLIYDRIVAKYEYRRLASADNQVIDSAFVPNDDEKPVELPETSESSESKSEEDVSENKSGNGDVLEGSKVDKSEEEKDGGSEEQKNTKAKKSKRKSKKSKDKDKSVQDEEIKAENGHAEMENSRNDDKSPTDDMPSETSENSGEETSDEEKTPTAPPDGIFRSLFNAVNSTSVSSGGLLSLMTLSICVGGIIDRANLNELLPQHFSSPIAAMAMLFIILVFIGMIMDPYGAVILVAATLTQIAGVNGIDPVHFWVTVLCAFELGYLTPPVALNQLLTRQVVGEQAFAYKFKDGTGFWTRHERLMMPLTVKGVVLLIVAFGPLIGNALHWL